MLVKQMVYFLCAFMSLASIIILIYSIINKKKDVCKGIIILSITYIVFLIYGIQYIILLLNLSTGWDMLYYIGLSRIAIILFIITIVISIIKLIKLKEIAENPQKYKLIILLLIIFPIIIFSFSYAREIYYINNSKLVLVFTSGENFNEKDFAYAINDTYCKEISIGTDFRGYKMAMHLPKGFKDLNYTWTTDKVNINDNKIVIYRNDEVIYEGKLIHKISGYGLREVFYK